MGQRLWSLPLDSSAPRRLCEQRQGSQSRLNSLSFALPILSLCSSYANRLFTFVKTKRRERRENREEQGEREGDKTGLRAARKQSSSFFFVAGCPQLLLLFLLLHLFFLFVVFPSLYFCETFAILCNFGEITDLVMTINRSFKSIYMKTFCANIHNINFKKTKIFNLNQIILNKIISYIYKNIYTN